jgi:hypothetical protein
MGRSRITFHALAVFCANSVPTSLASIQNGIRKSARCAVPHLFVMPVNLPIQSIRNATAAILIVEHSVGFPEFQVLGVLFAAPLNDDATVPEALQKFTYLGCLAKIVKNWRLTR